MKQVINILIIGLILISCYALLSEMNKNITKTTIGFSGLDFYEDCYIYNEDACVIADSEDSCRD